MSAVQCIGPARRSGLRQTVPKLSVHIRLTECADEARFLAA
jgi:hypothetical protein